MAPFTPKLSVSTFKSLDKVSSWNLALGEIQICGGEGYLSLQAVAILRRLHLLQKYLQEVTPHPYSTVWCFGFEQLCLWEVASWQSLQAYNIRDI